MEFDFDFENEIEPEEVDYDTLAADIEKIMQGVDIEAFSKELDEYLTNNNFE